MKQTNIENLTVAIIGGGIGGFATAVALQNKGIKAHIYEQAQALGEVGAGIKICPCVRNIRVYLNKHECLKYHVCF